MSWIARSDRAPDTSLRLRASPTSAVASLNLSPTSLSVLPSRSRWSFLRACAGGVRRQELKQ